MKILVLNAGSSSQKSRLYEIHDTPPVKPPPPLWEANADWTKEKNAAELTVTANGQTVNREKSGGFPLYSDRAYAAVTMEWENEDY